MSLFLILGIVFLLAAAACLWNMLRISKVVKRQRRFDGHDHAKLLKVCQRQHLPGAAASAGKAGTLSGMASPGEEYPLLAFDPEPRVHIETTTSFGFPKNFFQGVETVEIQYDINDPHQVYVCDERPVMARISLFRSIAIALAVVGALLVLLGL